MRLIEDYSVLYHLGVIESAFPRNKGVRAAIQMVRDIINNAPTRSPGDVLRKGKWAQSNNGVCWWWECTECHEPPLQRRGNDVLSSYCPNCGAEMIGVTDGDEFN